MTTTEREFTSDQIVESIGTALAEREFKIVLSLLKLLAAQEPRRAQEVLDVIEAGLALGRGEDVEVVVRPAGRRL
ncbi:hypothetical protein GCM10027258_62820 [Amycolatopsis stemonae]